MGRPVYTYELNDPDFSWLIQSFQENYPEFKAVECSNLPIVFIPQEAEIEEVRQTEQSDESKESENFPK